MVLKISVKECMRSSVVSFTVETPVYDAIGKFIEYKISGGPVINERQEVIGIFSESDALKAILKMAYHEEEVSFVVGDFMTQQVDTVHEADGLVDVASKFINMGRRRFPVINDDRHLVGQVSRRDILEAVQNFQSMSSQKAL